MYVSTDGQKNGTTDGQFIKTDGQLSAPKPGIYHFRLLAVPYNQAKCPKKIVEKVCKCFNEIFNAINFSKHLIYLIMGFLENIMHINFVCFGTSNFDSHEAGSPFYDEHIHGEPDKVID